MRIQNDDELCLARALVVARARLDQDPRYKPRVKHNRPVQTRLARELHDEADVTIDRCGIYEVKQFQAYLNDYQINIVSKELQGSLSYSGPDNEKRIYLYHHYDVITKMPGFFARRNYCHDCENVYDHRVDHICPSGCSLC